METDPLSTFLTPPSKRRKLAAVQPSPPKLSDMLAAFGAQRLPSSVSRMQKEADDARNLRPAKPRVSYAESDSEPVTPTSSPGGSSFGEAGESSKTSIIIDDDTDEELQRDIARQVMEDDEDELQSEDVIHGMYASFSPSLEGANSFVSLFEVTCDP